MPIYKFGFTVRQQREKLGITQEELSEGICSVPTLSRIENGNRLPSKDNFELLLQRLGLSESVLYTYVDDLTLFLHEERFKIRQAVILGHDDEALELLEDYKDKADMQSPTEQQFVLLNSTLASSSDYSAEERLARLEEAIRLTCPDYTEEVFPKFLSYEEIIILNNIAGCYLDKQDLKRAIKILSMIKQYYEQGTHNQEEVLRTQTMIYYNLSKCLGLAGRYDECIDICNLGIRIARETGRCSCMAQQFYNLAWSLSKRQGPGDMERAKEAAQNAYYTAVVMGSTDTAKRFKSFIEHTFNQ